MTALVVAQAVVLAVLALLVLALLRSHAEILRRLEERPPARRMAGEGGAGMELAPGVPAPAERAGAPPAVDLVGTTLARETVKVGLAPGGPSTLLAFLTSGCTLCQGLWRDLPPSVAPTGARVVAVTRDPDVESPGRLAELAPPGAAVVMSSRGWDAYGVPGAPYFIYVDGASGRIHGEGAATTWAQVGSLLRDAVLDSEHAAGAPGRPAVGGRDFRADQELQAAGVGPEHPSLRPGRDAGSA